MKDDIFFVKKDSGEENCEEGGRIPVCDIAGFTRYRTSQINKITAIFDEEFMDIEDEDYSIIEHIQDAILPPILEKMMMRYRYNKIRAAKVCGISPGNLRNKLRKYFGDKYFRDGIEE